MKDMIMLFLLATAFCTPISGHARTSIDRIDFGRFGTILLYGESSHPSSIVLFASGDGGWNKGVIDMASVLASKGALVAGIDSRRYLSSLERSKEACLYPASDFEALSKFIQKKLGLPRYHQPLLAGYSSGATLVYAVLVQAPPNTFRGAVSLGFCPTLPGKKPFCRGNGLSWASGPHGKSIRFLPAKNLREPWIALHGIIDRVCSAAGTAAFVGEVTNAEIVLLPHVGHGFAVRSRWRPQFEGSFSRLMRERGPQLQEAVNDLRDLPLIEVAAREPAKDVFAVILSGDGGWAGLDREVGETLALEGIAVVGLDSLRYFWTARTPAGMASDLERILKHYSIKWEKQYAILIGYSFGADVLPFAMSRLPDDLLGRVRLAVLLGPDREADFEFHITDWLGAGRRKTSRPILPEIEKLRGKRLLCFYGKKEDKSPCRQLGPDLAERITMEGGHHFGGNYQMIAEMILDRYR